MSEPLASSETLAAKEISAALGAVVKELQNIAKQIQNLEIAINKLPKK